MGYVFGIAITRPKPIRYVSRSRTVIARRAGTVSSRSEEMDRSTRRFASSGSHGSIESSSRTLHSSTRIIAATAVMGFVIEAMRTDRFLQALNPDGAFLQVSDGINEVSERPSKPIQPPDN